MRLAQPVTIVYRFVSFKQELNSRISFFFCLLSPLQPVHLYSIQTCNSMVLGKKEMREKLDPRSRYTYCQGLHHMTVEPVDSEQELKRFWKREDPKKWRTKEGCVGGRHNWFDSGIVLNKQAVAMINDTFGPTGLFILAWKLRCKAIPITTNSTHPNSLRWDWLNFQRNFAVILILGYIFIPRIYESVMLSYKEP